MNPETKLSSFSQEQSVVSAEIKPSKPALVQFIGHRQICGFQKSYLQQSDFILTEKRRQQPSRAPHELCLMASGLTVTLVGWRLNLLAELLASGKVNFIRAIDGASANMDAAEPLVCYIHISWRNSASAITLLPPKARH